MSHVIGHDSCDVICVSQSPSSRPHPATNQPSRARPKRHHGPYRRDGQPDSLDIQFEKITQVVNEGSVIVWISDPHRSPMVFKKFHAGLSSKRVSKLVWHRRMSSAAAQRALKDEVRRCKLTSA